MSWRWTRSAFFGIYIYIKWFIPGDGDDSGSTENDGDDVILRPSS